MLAHGVEDHPLRVFAAIPLEYPFRHGLAQGWHLERIHQLSVRGTGLVDEIVDEGLHAQAEDVLVELPFAVNIELIQRAGLNGEECLQLIDRLLQSGFRYLARQIDRADGFGAPHRVGKGLPVRATHEHAEVGQQLADYGQDGAAEVFAEHDAHFRRGHRFAYFDERNGIRQGAAEESLVPLAGLFRDLGQRRGLGKGEGRLPRFECVDAAAEFGPHHVGIVLVFVAEVVFDAMAGHERIQDRLHAVPGLRRGDANLYATIDVELHLGYGPAEDEFSCFELKVRADGLKHPFERILGNVAEEIFRQTQIGKERLGGVIQAAGGHESFIGQFHDRLVEHVG